MNKSWSEKIEETYPDKKKRIAGIIKEISPSVANRMDISSKMQKKPKLKVWFGTMTPEAKKSRKISFAEIDKKLVELSDKGYRIVKSSAITPEGEYDIYKSPAKDAEPSASNLFFELKMNKKEFEDIYDRFGRYDNNFPDYFTSDEEFKKYTQKSDIFIVEDIKTNRPVGFATYNLVDVGTDEAKEYKDDCNLEIKDKLIYNDTIALSGDLQSKGIGKLVCDIVDGYYLQSFGENNEYGLYTGEINTTNKGSLAKDFHEKRGFGNWVESEAPLDKWLKRYKSIEKKAKKYKGDYKAYRPQVSMSSYRGM